MKIVLLSGAIKNAGDYLITERAKRILQYCYPQALINTIVRNYQLDDKLSMLNEADVIVIAGGPSYKKTLYPKDIPLVHDLNLVKSKIFIMGAGWYGGLTNDKEIRDYEFTLSSKRLLKRITKDSVLLGCRDYYSVKVLYANGFCNCIMTGCPAWYDLDKLSKRLTLSKEINKIMISDPADVRSYGQQSIDIVRALRNLYPRATIEYVFHRGIEEDDLTNRKTANHIKKITNVLNSMGIKYHNIAYGFEGFHLYDDCDIHVGHRVHAHIYNLSQRNISILFEEDSRGAGVNEALGLIGIKAYERKISSNTNIFIKGVNKYVTLTKTNRYAISDLNNYINYINKTNGLIFNIAYSSMEYYFTQMINHVKTIEKI